jgi:hypothetical protein
LADCGRRPGPFYTQRDDGGAAAELAGIGPRRPLLTPGRIGFFGVTSLPPGDPAATGEDRTLAGLPSRTVRAAEVAADPVAAAHEAATALTTTADGFLLQFDVDVIDFYDLPAANWSEYNKGLTLEDPLVSGGLARLGRDEARDKIKRDLRHLTPAVVDRERVATVRDLHELGHPWVAPLPLVGGVRDRQRDRNRTP